MLELDSFLIGQPLECARTIGVLFDNICLDRQIKDVMQNIVSLPKEYCQNKGAPNRRVN